MNVLIYGNRTKTMDTNYLQTLHNENEVSKMKRFFYLLNVVIFFK
jgi:hypothetical protein